MSYANLMVRRRRSIRVAALVFLLTSLWLPTIGDLPFTGDGVGESPVFPGLVALLVGFFVPSFVLASLATIAFLWLLLIDILIPESRSGCFVAIMGALLAGICGYTLDYDVHVGYWAWLGSFVLASLTYFPLPQRWFADWLGIPRFGQSSLLPRTDV